ncbi:MAG: cupin domain-containing protein [Eubacteriales bacterium]
MAHYQIGKVSEDGYIPVLDGIERKTLVFGENTLMAEFRLKKEKLIPAHKHPHEQTGYLVSGRIMLIIAGREFEIRPGDSWSIPGDMEHGVRVLEDSIAVEVFAPVREDYLP